MSSFEKYRIHEVAKDFGLPSKTVTEIMTEYFAPPKNHMQILETPELDIIFEYLTQRHQVATVEELFAVPKTEPKPEKKTESKAEKKPEKKAEDKGGKGQEKGGMFHEGSHHASHG